MDKYNRKSIVQLPRQNTIDRPRKKILQKRLLAILIIFLLIWTFLALIRSDLFALKEIEISGHIHTPENEIQNALGVSLGANIWKISMADLKERVEDIPRIEESIINRHLPSKISVAITEKECIALIPYGEYLIEVSCDGQIIGTTQSSHDYGVPLLTGFAPICTEIGENLLDGDLLRNVTGVLSALARYQFAVSEINLADEENLVVVMLDGLVVWMGDNDFLEKADLLAQICAQFNDQKAQGYLDLRAKDAPVFCSAE